MSQFCVCVCALVNANACTMMFSLAINFQLVGWTVTQFILFLMTVNTWKVIIPLQPWDVFTYTHHLLRRKLTDSGILVCRECLIKENRPSSVTFYVLFVFFWGKTSMPNTWTGNKWSVADILCVCDPLTHSWLNNTLRKIVFILILRF